MVQDTDMPHAAYDSIFHYLSQEIDCLKESDAGNIGSTRILDLASHKRKAILATVPKLLLATGRAYSTANVKKAFILNGQIDVSKKLVPDIANLIHTYRGISKTHTLNILLQLCRNFIQKCLKMK